MNTKELLPLLAAAPLLTATPALGNEMNDTLLAFQKQYEAAMVEFGEWDETEQTLITGTPTDPLSTEVKKEPKITSKKATWKAALGPLGVLLLAPGFP